MTDLDGLINFFSVYSNQNLPKLFLVDIAKYFFLLFQMFKAIVVSVVCGQKILHLRVIKVH